MVGFFNANFTMSKVAYSKHQQIPFEVTQRGVLRYPRKTVPLPYHSLTSFVLGCGVVIILGHKV